MGKFFEKVAGLGIAGTSGIGTVFSLAATPAVGPVALIPAGINGLFTYGGIQLLRK